MALEANSDDAGDMNGFVNTGENMDFSYRAAP